MTRIAAFALALLGMSVLAFAQTNSPADPLLTAKSKCAEAEQKIAESQKAAEQAALGRYGKAIDEVAKVGTAQASVPTVVAAQTEKDRLLKEGTVPATDPNDVIAPIVKARTVYRQEIQGISTDVARQRAALLNQYFAHLKGIAKGFLTSKRMEDAKKVQEELDRVDFMLAELQSKLPPVSPPALATTHVESARTSSPASWVLGTGMANLKTNLIVDLGDGVKMDLVLIRAGSFKMGSDVWGAKPVHKVTITKPFYMGKYEVTQEQWKKVMGTNPSKLKGTNLPVECVSWDDCQRYIEKLQETYSGQGKFALPTEAQWEYACRADSSTDYSFGDKDDRLAEHAWFKSNSEETTHPIGEKKPNAWGLYDMHGNVYEWCQDWCEPFYGSKKEETDPAGPSSGASGRILRGGSCKTEAASCRSFTRYARGQSVHYDIIGLRVVLSP